MADRSFRAFQPGQEGLGPTTTGTAGARGVNEPVPTVGSTSAGSATNNAVGSSNIAADGTPAAPIPGEQFTNNGVTALSFTQGKVSLSDSKVLKFPSSRDIGANSDYVSFTFQEYQPPFKAAGDAGGAKSPYSSYNASVTNGASFKQAEGFEPIILYMPEDISTETAGDWTSAGFGPMIRGAAEIAADIGRGEVPNSVNALNNIPATLERGKYQAILQSINAALGAQITENQLLGGSTGSILNPNAEMMYEAPRLRNFTLRFKMSPRDEKEAQIIKKICNTFRKASLPSFQTGEGLIAGASPGFFLKIPKICRVSFLRGGTPHPFLSQYKPCAISRVSVNYTPDGTYATYKGGSPVATELTISFQELKLIFSEEVNVDGGGF